MEFIERIDEWGRTTPGKIAHEAGGQSITFGELKERSDALADVLRATLPDDHSPVAVLGHKEPEVVVAFIACIKSGHPYVPLDTVLPQQRIDATLQSSGARITLT